MVCRPASRADSWVSFCASEIITWWFDGAVGLDAGIVDAGTVGRLANSVRVRRLLKLDIDQRAAAEIDAQIDVVPEQNREDARHAEDQRKGEEVPLLPQPIDVNAMKQFHSKTPPCSCASRRGSCASEIILTGPVAGATRWKAPLRAACA